MAGTTYQIGAQFVVGVHGSSSLTGLQRATVGVQQGASAVGAKFQTAGRQAQSSAARATRAWRGVGEVTKRALIGVGATAAVGGVIFNKVVNLAADFQTQMSGAQAVLGATSKELQTMTALAMKMGKETSFSAKEAANGITQLGSAGMSVKDILNGGLKGTLMLAAATGLKDLGFAGETAATTLNVFKLRGQDVAHVADVIANAANQSALTVQDFSAALTTGGGDAKQFGLNLEDFTASLTLMADKGIKGAMAGTQLGSAFTMAANASQANKKLMDKEGFSIYTATGARKKYIDVVRNLEQSVKGMSAAERDAFLHASFGSYGINAMNAVLDAGSKKLLEREKALAKVGAAEKASKILLDNLRGSQDQFAGSLETIGISVGTRFLPSLKRMTDRGTVELNHFLDAIDSPAGGAKITAFAGKLESMANDGISSIGKVVSFLDSHSGEISSFGKGFSESVTGAFNTAGLAAKGAYDTTRKFLELIGQVPKVDEVKGTAGPHFNQAKKQAENQAAQKTGQVAGVAALALGGVAAVVQGNEMLGGIPEKILSAGLGALSKRFRRNRRNPPAGGGDDGGGAGLGDGTRVFVTNMPIGGLGGGDSGSPLPPGSPPVPPRPPIPPIPPRPPSIWQNAIANSPVLKFFRAIPAGIKGFFGTVGAGLAVRFAPLLSKLGLASSLIGRAAPWLSRVGIQAGARALPALAGAGAGVAGAAVGAGAAGYAAGTLLERYVIPKAWKDSMQNFFAKNLFGAPDVQSPKQLQAEIAAIRNRNKQPAGLDINAGIKSAFNNLDLNGIVSRAVAGQKPAKPPEIKIPVLAPPQIHVTVTASGTDANKVAADLQASLSAAVTPLVNSRLALATAQLQRRLDGGLQSLAAANTKVPVPIPAKK